MKKASQIFFRLAFPVILSNISTVCYFQSTVAIFANSAIAAMFLLAIHCSIHSLIHEFFEKLYYLLLPNFTPLLSPDTAPVPPARPHKSVSRSPPHRL